MRGVTDNKNISVCIAVFQLTRLMRGVTDNKNISVWIAVFQLTRLMRGVTATLGRSFPPFPHFNSHASCEA